MDKNEIFELMQNLSRKDIKCALPRIIDLTIEYGKEIPEQLSSELNAACSDWSYYNTMVYYAVRWYNMGFSPSKLKKLMDEAIQEMSGPENETGKYSATKMFMDYLQHKKNIDEYLNKKLSAK